MKLTRLKHKAKGRNGLFHAAEVDVVPHATDPAVVTLQVWSRRQGTAVPPIELHLAVEDARALGTLLKKGLEKA